MSTNAVTPVAEMPEPMHLLATTPAAMAAAMQSMVGWAEQRVAAAERDVDEARRTLDAAKAAGFGNVGQFSARLRREKGRLRFYEKVKAALEAGYYIVPPFPITIFAIRSDRDYARPEVSPSSYEHFAQAATALEAGKGDWKSPLPEVYARRIAATGKDGQPVEKIEYFPRQLVAPDFPFTLVKPELIEATRAAMGGKFFDALGVVSGQCDPILIGQIKRPGTRWAGTVNFFVAWWLDTKEL